jgi:hypothetical protein
VDQVIFYEYQSYSGTTPTINHVNYQIWNGPPNGGGTVVFGDMTTNRLVSAAWDNLYRVLDTGLTNTDRPVMALTCSGFTLPPGTYWIDWQAGGSGSYTGPWQPPITILGQTTTGNALQYYSGAWDDIVDGITLTPQGLPFTFLQCQAGGGGPTYDMNFRDQYNRSELCLDSTTGDYIYNVLTGAHAGDSFTGTATITPYGTTMFLFAAPCGGGATHCVSGSWNTTRHTASAILKSFTPMRYSQSLSDANYTDSPPCGP